VAIVPANVTFDSTKLQFTGVTEGDFLKQGGAPTNFSSRVGQNGQLSLSDSVSGGSGASASGTYAVLTFRAIAPTSQTAIQVQPGTMLGLTGIPVTTLQPSPYDLTVIAK
jgi:general secretion pathway protein D